MNVSVVGSKGLAAQLGKGGTSSDITLYNSQHQGRYFVFIEPETYPEKVQTVFQAVNMSQFSILYIKNDIPKNILGECILALDILKRDGIVVLDGVNPDEIKPVLEHTSLKNFPIIENDTAKIISFLLNLDIKPVEDRPKVVIDHSFLVKSVGTIALGTVMSGEINKHDDLILYPSKKNVMVKSIQIHDKEYEKAVCYDRVGLSIKGAEVDDLERGSIISNDIECVKELEVRLEKNKFFQDEIPKNVMCIIGLQYVNSNLDDEKISFNKEVAFDNEKIIVLSPDKKMRIIGIAENIS